MFNVLIDSLPHWYQGHAINPDHDVGIQISQIFNDDELTDWEKYKLAVGILFVDAPDTPEQAMEGIKWFLNGWSTDPHPEKSDSVPVMDFDRDQWRIWAAIKQQYGIDLSQEAVHWWVFMGMISNLSECSLTSVIEIRQKKIMANMSSAEKKAIAEAQKIYGLEQKECQSEEDKKAVDEFMSLLNKKKR